MRWNASWRACILVGLVLVAVFLLAQGRINLRPSAPAGQFTQSQYQYEITEFATGLEVPWDIAFDTGGELYVTERPGRLKIFQSSGQLERTITISAVSSEGESGLTGLALHPNFTENQLIYLYYSYRKDEGLENRVSRFGLAGGELKDEQPIVDRLPGGPIHNGGRLRFGPDGQLYILTGDAGQAELAQDRTSLAGKILRVNDDGSIPTDNPFPGSAVYSLGHRNPQGLDWQPESGELFAIEHGQSAHDELNFIQPGQNYGWPEEQECESDNPRFTNPILCSDELTWAPSGLAFIRNSLFFAGLRGQLLERVEIKAGKVVSRERVIEGQYGRLRAVTKGPDGALYVTTSNRDGRGKPEASDDRILKVDQENKPGLQTGNREVRING